MIGLLMLRSRVLGKESGGAPIGNKNAAKNNDSNTTVVLKKPIGRGRSYILARLDRDGLTDLATKVRSKELSANAAAVAAGWRKKPTIFEQAQKFVAKMTKTELRKFRQWFDKEFGS